ncbi:hypothetical protein HPP92_026799 [Vanilla planifolia]|uniref:Uncharacterized protein n=1 Tax=Vanilla planifolia TaxID=51239 RepID=A0A835U933_VANPL|nr:hypothetical protein HPP92_026799 [Vanilla planifolia]
MAISSAAAGSRIKFLNPARRPQSTDISAGVAWGVAATTTALWLIQSDRDFSRHIYQERGQEVA